MIDFRQGDTIKVTRKDSLICFGIIIRFHQMGWITMYHVKLPEKYNSFQLGIADNICSLRQVLTEKTYNYFK